MGILSDSNTIFGMSMSNTWIKGKENSIGQNQSD